MQARFASAAATRLVCKLLGGGCLAFYSSLNTFINAVQVRPEGASYVFTRGRGFESTRNGRS